MVFRWIFTSASVHCSRSVCNQIYLFVLFASFYERVLCTAIKQLEELAPRLLNNAYTYKLMEMTQCLIRLYLCQVCIALNMAKI